MLETVDVGVGTEGSPTLRLAGDVGNGDYRCTGCGYGIVVLRVLPTCPMCRGQEWAPREFSPFRQTAD